MIDKASTRWATQMAVTVMFVCSLELLPFLQGEPALLSLAPVSTHGHPGQVRVLQSGITDGVAELMHGNGGIAVLQLVYMECPLIT